VSPRVAIGVPLYNRADHLEEALDSLLAQEYDDFALVLLDDASTDATPNIAARYAEHHPRVTFERNERRLGMTENWRRVFIRAREIHPGALYFAWGSDHDVWGRRWLPTLVAALDADPRLVMAQTKGHRISDSGHITQRELLGFDNVGISAWGKRFPETVKRMEAGSMIYGLFRTELVARCGVFPSTLLPDRLLLAKLSLHGEFRWVPEFLWLRRYREGEEPSLARQRRAFYPDGAPLRARLPWWLQHAAAMSTAMRDRDQRPRGTSPLTGQAIAVWYFELSLTYSVRRRLRRLRKGTQRFRKRNSRRLRASARRTVDAIPLTRSIESRLRR
jgi:glycosyltransferase involved in cell wall biosynthesis